MTTYYYQNQPISNIIVTGGSVSINQSSYKNFPNVSSPIYTTTKLDLPFPLGYTINKVDIYTNCMAYYKEFDTAGTTQLTLPLDNMTIKPKHISCYCWGGGGGGGGGGGAGWNGFGVGNTGGAGGNGGKGGYAGAVQYLCNNIKRIDVTVGSGGLGGAGGPAFNGNKADQGWKGKPGDPGNASYVTFYNDLQSLGDCIRANGGLGGGGGMGGETADKGAGGGNGDPGNGEIGPNTTPGSATTTTTTTGWPTQNSGNGTGGGNGGSGANRAPGNKAGDASSGYVRIYFLYQ